MDYFNPLSYNLLNRQRRIFYSRRPFNSTSFPLYIRKYKLTGCDLLSLPGLSGCAGSAKKRPVPGKVLEAYSVFSWRTGCLSRAGCGKSGED